MASDKAKEYSCTPTAELTKANGRTIANTEKGFSAIPMPPHTKGASPTAARRE